MSTYSGQVLSPTSADGMRADWSSVPNDATIPSIHVPGAPVLSARQGVTLLRPKLAKCFWLRIFEALVTQHARKVIVAKWND
jgi:hypothetical protein